MGWSLPLVIGGIIGAIIVIIINTFCERALKRRAIEKGWAYHGFETGKFVWINEDAEYVINGVDESSGNDKPSVFSMKGISVKKD